MMRYADCLQVGARNMQNFDLLKELGRVRKPVLLKRGLSATIEEWLLSAEYILAGGNGQVILCERGIRTFENYTRNTLDISAIPVVKKRSHLPIMVDPSHGTGRREKVIPMARAAVAAGADGLIIEVHNNPEKALSDGPQSLYPDQFDRLMGELRIIAPVLGRTVPLRAGLRPWPPGTASWRPASGAGCPAVPSSRSCSPCSSPSRRSDFLVDVANVGRIDPRALAGIVPFSGLVAVAFALIGISRRYWLFVPVVGLQVLVPRGSSGCGRQPLPPSRRTSSGPAWSSTPGRPSPPSPSATRSSWRSSCARVPGGSARTPRWPSPGRSTCRSSRPSTSRRRGARCTGARFRRARWAATSSTPSSWSPGPSASWPTFPATGFPPALSWASSRPACARASGPRGTSARSSATSTTCSWS